MRCPRPIASAWALVLLLAVAAGRLDVRGAERAVAATVPAPAPSEAGPFAVGTDTLEITGVTWIESWNKNQGTDRLIGGRVVLGRDWHPEWQSTVELELQRVRLARSRDAFLAGVSGLVRRRLLTIGRSETFVEVGLGAALATRAVPSRGTAFNFLLQAGAGVARPLTLRTSLVAGARLWHLSNGGVIRNQAHNPDIEGLGGYAGLQIHFR